ncbi:ABC transporter permease [Streptacidiphilus carbonis]|uniref:ABC transporter permease n=1 Tax=Streptacidiphilus carbonis TaxID=105422 RepID=UPI0005AAB54B|nr:ABC transporter permease [Streptacidiphilus carbonis]
MASGVSGARQSRGFGAELRDAVTTRAFLLVIGVLGLQLGFIVSYVGALHHPYPHKASMAVVAPAQVGGKLVAQLNALPKNVLDARAVADEETARRQIKDQKVYSALLFNAAGTQDTLMVANASGPALATAIEKTLTGVEQQQGRTFTTVDVVPLAAGDAEGLSSFYLAVGLCVGGYLVASILGISAGSRPANRKRAVIRLGVLALYSIAAGIGAAVVVGPVLNALPGSVVALWGIGALVVFAVGAITMALECLFDVVGIGIAVLLFVVLGNPSAGGVFPPPLMPPFWRAIGPWLPNGAGTSLARSIAYFNGTAITKPLLVLVVWAVVGVVVALVATAFRPGRGRGIVEG